MSESSEYMNIKEVADMLKITRKTVYSMIKAGKLEAIQNPIDSRERIIKRHAVEALAQFARPAKKDAA